MRNETLILAIESSCDETAVAILRNGKELLVSEISSQIDLHRKYGGVVPEVASRNHLARIQPLIRGVVAKTGLRFSDLDCVAATRGPGLLTSLLVGYSVGKALSIGLRKPFIGVNHLEGHLLSPFFGDDHGVRPAIGLVVSGGHTLLLRITEMGSYLLLGRTLDDAAGEAFDKVAKMLGLPYPGGPAIDRLAQGGDPSRFQLPRSMVGSGDLNFSFSGLKTAVRYLLPKLEGDFHADLAASFQEAVVDILVKKTIQAAASGDISLITVSGGVSCNTRLREKISKACKHLGFQLRFAPADLSTDNAAMIAYVAHERFSRGDRSSLLEDADPNMKLGLPLAMSC
jgi:N6-L-threonylcarbamoyladenine synthase